MLLAPIVYTLVGACLLLPITGMAESTTPQKRTAPAQISAKNPALAAFIQAVWDESPAMKEARANLDAAQARVHGAGKPLHNPNLEVDAERSDINTQTIGISQTLDWSDKQGVLLDITRKEQQAAEAAYREERRSTTLETLQALAEYVTASEIFTLAEHRGRLMRTLVETVEQRQAAGDVQALDVTLAQVAYNEASMTQSIAKNARFEAESALQSVSGLQQSRWPSMPELSSTQEIDATANANAFKQLPTLVMLSRQMEAARLRVRLAEKAGRIDPTLGVRAGKEDNETLLGLSLEIPLFVRNNYQSEARAVSHDAIAAEQRYRDAYRRAQAHLSGAFKQYNNTLHAWRIWKENGEHAQREQMRLLDQLWQAGELSVTDYLIQAKQNIDSQEAAVRLLGEVRRTQLTWLAAANQIEQWLGLSKPAIETNSGERR